MMDNYADTKDHYGVIIMGAGLSGLACAIQLGRKLGYEDAIVYEKSGDIGGTWSANTYPGAGCDIPISLYSYSFARSAEFSSQWALQSEIMTYLRSVRKKFDVKNIRFHTRVDGATWSAEKGVWTLLITDLETQIQSTKTCTILIAAVGGLSVPSIPEFKGQDKFQGEIFHSAQWRHDVSIAGKNVIMVGNGCSASQIIPTIAPEVGSLTQLARSRQSILRRLPIPESWLFTFMLRKVPGVLFAFRALLFFMLEGFFKVSDITKGAGLRKAAGDDGIAYMKETTPEKYWNMLTPNFDIGAKRRIFDSGYLKALGRDNVELLEDGIAEFKENSIVTNAGTELPADVVILSTGFRVQEFLFPLSIINGEGESLRERFKTTDVSSYLSTCYAGYPNFFTLMGPNSATGHSSVIYTSEAQINMILKLIKPILALTSIPQSLSSTPSSSSSDVSTSLLAQEDKARQPVYISVKPEAEKEFMQRLRLEMKKKVWEKDGGKSWYVDRETGLCTTLYPWSQIHFWWNASFPVKAHYERVGF